MSRQVSTGVFNQKLWPGVGAAPYDDCVILADFMAAHAVRPELTLPSIAAYRAAAGVPDTDGKSEGLSLDDSIEAIRIVWPDLDAERYLGTWAGFLERAKTTNAVASVSVLSGALPTTLRYGFLLNHRITVFWTGSAWRVLNPLAPAHSKAKAIIEAALKLAMEKYPTAEAAAAIIFRPGAR